MGGVLALPADPPLFVGYPPPELYDTAKGCDVYAFDFATGTERRVAEVSSPKGTEFWPTIWRDRVAFGRVYDDKRDYPYVYVRRLDSSAPSRRLPGGQRKTCERNRSTRRLSCTPPTHSRPVALDLYGDRLAFMWAYQGFAEGRDTEIRVDEIGADHRVVAVQGGGGLSQSELGWPSFAAGSLYYAQTCFGDGCTRDHNALFRYRYSTRERSRADAAGTVVSHARDRGRTYVLRNEAFGTACASDSDQRPFCHLVALQPTYG